MSEHNDYYYLPEPSRWPLIGSIALFCIMLGFANWLHGHSIGPVLFSGGWVIMLYMMHGWFGQVIKESCSGAFNRLADHSFRWGMAWFIFSEVMFFSAFFFALFYARLWAVPWIGGEDGYQLTRFLIWPDFIPHWPLLKTPDPNLFHGAEAVIPAWGIPALNTFILLSSGVTITIAHAGLLKNKRKLLNTFLGFTILLGISFLAFQGHEYMHAYSELNLKLSSGIYGTTFFMLTGFHGLHVTIGTIMLITIWLRCLKGHFNPEHHFAFEAVAWYWHFVDVVWLFLFVFVYWL